MEHLIRENWRFGTSAGKHCACNLLFLILYSQLKRTRKWKTADLDLIPACGDKAYKDLFLFYFYFFLFIQKHIYNGHINKMKKTKTKIHIAVIRCKATIIPEIKLKKEQLQN